VFEAKTLQISRWRLSGCRAEAPCDGSREWPGRHAVGPGGGCRAPGRWSPPRSDGGARHVVRGRSVRGSNADRDSAVPAWAAHRRARGAAVWDVPAGRASSPGPGVAGSHHRPSGSVPARGSPSRPLGPTRRRSSVPSGQPGHRRRSRRVHPRTSSAPTRQRPAPHR